MLVVLFLLVLFLLVLFLLAVLPPPLLALELADVA